MPQLFNRPAAPLPVLSPMEALERSRARLDLLQRLAERPEISTERRDVLENLVRAQEAVVAGRKRYLGRIN